MTRAQRRVRPIHDQILVKQDPPRAMTKSGLLHVPDGLETWPPIATVIEVGPGRRDAGGQRVEPDVQIGDRVLFKRRASTALEPDSREPDPEWPDLIMLEEADIIGVVCDEQTPGLEQAT